MSAGGIEQSTQLPQQKSHQEPVLRKGLSHGCALQCSRTGSVAWAGRWDSPQRGPWFCQGLNTPSHQEKSFRQHESPSRKDEGARIGQMVMGAHRKTPFTWKGGSYMLLVSPSETRQLGLKSPGWKGGRGTS